MTMDTIILASGSAQRRKLLDQAQIPYLAVTPQVDEASITAADTVSRVKKLASAKIAAVLPMLAVSRRRWVAGFDTVIECEGQFLGKPTDRENAAATLTLLSGKTHKVVTGVSLLPVEGSVAIVEACISYVQFKTMNRDEMEFYLDTGEWEGAAGAYRIQGVGAFFTPSVRGSYSNVVGLPLSLFYSILVQAGYVFT